MTFCRGVATLGGFWFCRVISHDIGLLIVHFVTAELEIWSDFHFFCFYFTGRQLGDVSWFPNQIFEVFLYSNQKKGDIIYGSSFAYLMGVGLKLFRLTLDSDSIAMFLQLILDVREEILEMVGRWGEWCELLVHFDDVDLKRRNGIEWINPRAR